MQRQLQQIINAQATSDGAGVRIMRTLGQTRFARLDPFLMLDEFGSSDADDYIAGFPSHPHRGFETVTYMLEGHMLHQDHLGNEGLLDSGDVQWMTAGRGIIHSEMPRQESGVMRGFQLWINLPAAEKMKPAHYQDIKADTIPQVQLAKGGSLKLIAGEYDSGGTLIQGAVTGITTQPTYFDVALDEGQEFTHQIPQEHSCFIYVYEGELRVGADRRPLKQRQLGVLVEGEDIQTAASSANTRFLLLAAKPIKEPVVQYGPFVMNTQEEIEQAITDYRQGLFGS
jgi:redox-sensitive bicupin YhaK (pirin superfamily)